MCLPPFRCEGCRYDTEQNPATNGAVFPLRDDDGRQSGRVCVDFRLSFEVMCIRVGVGVGVGVGMGVAVGVGVLPIIREMINWPFPWCFLQSA